MRDAGAMRGMPDATAGLPRRYAPRNDNAKIWGMPKRPLDCRVAALLAMTKGGEWRARWVPSCFSDASHNAVIASPAGRGNQVSSLLCHCEEGLEKN
jgi:hypothetical protein